jgi:hypothetical protein
LQYLEEYKDFQKFLLAMDKKFKINYFEHKRDEEQAAEKINLIKNTPSCSDRDLAKASVDKANVIEQTIKQSNASLSLNDRGSASSLVVIRHASPSRKIGSDLAEWIKH